MSRSTSLLLIGRFPNLVVRGMSLNLRTWIILVIGHSIVFVLNLSRGLEQAANLCTVITNSKLELYLFPRMKTGSASVMDGNFFAMAGKILLA